MAEDTLYKFRHKSVRRFRTAGYQFKDFNIVIVGDEERAKFLEVVGRLPQIEKIAIVEVDVEAERRSERSIDDMQANPDRDLGVGKAGPGEGNQAIRGAMGAEQISTQKDGQGAAAPSSQANTSGNSLTGGAPAPKPAGFSLQNLNLGK